LHPQLVTLVLGLFRLTDLEWFRLVVIETLELSTALAAQQEEGDQWADRAPPGTYRGFWTFEPTLVQQIVGILRQAARILVGETE
jgi:hypothetical protein